MSLFLYFFQPQKRTNKNTDLLTLKQYLEAIMHYKNYSFTTAIGSAIGTICLNALLPFELSQSINLISRYQSLSANDPLIKILIVSSILAITGALSTWIGVIGLSKLDSRAQNYLREKIFNRLTHESATFYANTMTGALAGNVTTYINSYASIQNIFFQLGLNLILPIIVSISLAAFQSIPLAILFIIITSVIAIKTLRDSRKRQAYRYKRKEAANMLNGLISDVIINISTVRTFAREKFEYKNLLMQEKSWQIASQKNLEVFGKHSSELIAGINILQIIGIAIAAWLATTGQINLGLLVFAIIYFQRLSSGLLELAPIVQTYQGAMMDASPISEILMREPTIIDYSKAKALKITKGEIYIDKLNYKYQDDNSIVLNNFSLHIPGRQSLGIVGRSGSGKTTLTTLLLRFADLQSGTIRVDNQDISKVTQHSLRNAISYVPQDTQLFHRSIRENIAYGKPYAKDIEIIQAAKEAQIWDFIKNLPEGLDTKVGDRGVKLSGGQRQRIAIARAILKNAPIIIFDEATSALDSESEKLIQEAIEELIKNRTAIIIAHRLSTIKRMDRIITIDKGRIIEDGTHMQLVNRKGLYTSLWKHQSGGFINETSYIRSVTTFNS